MPYHHWVLTKVKSQVARDEYCWGITIAGTVGG